MDGVTFLKDYAPVVSPALNIVSITGSSIVLIIALVLGIFKPTLMNRVTLRLQIGISLFDLLTHVFAMFHHIKDASPAFCTFIGFYRSFGNMVYCFLNIAIALNLQLVFLHSLQPSNSWEIAYWCAVIGLSLIANIPPLAFDYFGKNADGLCFFKAGMPKSNLILTVNINATMIFTCLYCLTVSVFVVVKLLQNVSVLNQMKAVTTSTNTEFRPKLVSHLKKLIFRISLYPIVCFMCLSGFIARFIVTETGGDRNTLLLVVWSMVGLTTTGFFNFVAFCLDPTLHNALTDFTQDMRHRYRSRTHAKNYALETLSSNNGFNRTSEVELVENCQSNDDDKTNFESTTPSIYEGVEQQDVKALDEFKRFL